VFVIGLRMWIACVENLYFSTLWTIYTTRFSFTIWWF